MRKYSKRRIQPRSSRRKTAKQNKAAAQMTTHKTVKPRRGTQPQPHPSSANQTERRTETKRAGILAMLRDARAAAISIGRSIEVLTASTNREIDMVFAIGWEHARVCDRGLGNNGIVWIDEHRKT